MASKDPSFIPKLKAWWDKQTFPILLVFCGSVSTWIEENIADPPGLFREISVNGSGSTTDIGFGRVKHFTVQYREGGATGPVLRNSTIIPTVVSYCP
jgi:hypothetical protein